MQPLTSLLVNSLKDLFGKEEQSDCWIDIIETEEVNFQLANGDRSSRKRSATIPVENDVLYCTLPVHSCILTLQSEYFKTMYECSLKESKSRKMTLKVGKGEGVYVKLFVQSFYDHDIFNSMDIYNYLQVMEIADRYICDVVIQQALAKKDSLKIEKLDDCEKVVQRIKSTNYGLPIMKELAKALVSKCSNYAASIFCPLEMKLFSDDTQFKQLSVDLLLGILKSNVSLAYSENSLLHYVLKWFAFDSSRQSEEIIEELTGEINYKNLTADYLLDVVTEKHAILSQWSNYNHWFLLSIAYHAHSFSRPCLGDFDKIKNLNSRSRYYSKENPLFFNIEFVKDSNKCFQKLTDTFIYQGYEISPVVTFEECDAVKKQIDIQFEVLNLREHNIPSDDDALLNVKVVIGIQGNPKHPKATDSTVFERIYLGNCFTDEATFYIDSTKIKLGHIENFCLTEWHCFSLYIALINEYGDWPDSFPTMLRESESEFMSVTWANI